MTYWVHPFYLLGVLSFFMGLGGAFVYKRLTDQDALEATARKIRISQLDMRLNLHRPAMMMRAQMKILKLNGRYFMQSAPAVGAIIVMMIGFLISFDYHFALAPVRPGEVFTVTSHAGSDSGEIIFTTDTKKIPDGIVWIEDDPLLGRAVFRAKKPGEYSISLIINGAVVKKNVVVKEGSGIAFLTPTLSSPGLFDLLYATESADLPDGVAKVTVDYVEVLSPISFFGWYPDWLWFFFIVSLLSIVLLKKALDIK